MLQKLKGDLGDVTAEMLLQYLSGSKIHRTVAAEDGTKQSGKFIQMAENAVGCELSSLLYELYPRIYVYENVGPNIRELGIRMGH